VVLAGVFGLFVGWVRPPFCFFSPAFLEVLWFVFSSTCFKFRENLKQVEVMGLCAIAVA
jgi:hypothetical protein